MPDGTTPAPEGRSGFAVYSIELHLKATLELLTRTCAAFYSQNACGKHQDIGDGYRNVVGIFMNQMMEGLSMPVFGDGMWTTAFTHIDDVTPLAVSCVDNDRTKRMVLNAGREQSRTVPEGMHVTPVAFDGQPGIEHLRARNEVVHAFSSNALCEPVFGRRQALTLQEGADRMARWAKQHGPRTTRPFTGIEGERNLPPSWRQ